jgi:proteasome lid subunit RPN8/RPN11
LPVRLQLQSEQVRALRAALERAGTNEIGGQIYGEQLAVSNFLVTDLTFQRRPGTFARFVVDLVQAARDSLKFLDRTEHRYTRFNYIGEWHSHPSFEVRPSSTDVASMRGLVQDPEFRGNFAVLMIVRLDAPHVTCGGWLFDPPGHTQAVTIDLLHD